MKLVTTQTIIVLFEYKIKQIDDKMKPERPAFHVLLSYFMLHMF